MGVIIKFSWSTKFFELNCLMVGGQVKKVSKFWLWKKNTRPPKGNPNILKPTTNIMVPLKM